MMGAAQDAVPIFLCFIIQEGKHEDHREKTVGVDPV